MHVPLRSRRFELHSLALISPLALFLAAGCSTFPTTSAESASTPATQPAAAAGPTDAGLRQAANQREAVEVKLAPREVGKVTFIKGEKQPVPKLRLGDPSTVARIIDEGKNRNQVMNHLRHISEEIGPRLTGSSNAEKANLWAMDQFASWGLKNSQIWKWGEIPVRFDRGPSKAQIMLGSSKKNDDGTSTTEYKSYRDMEFSTLAWTGGTSGPVRGPVVRMPESDAEFEQVKDKLKGAWVLIKPPQISGRVGMRQIGGGINERAFARYIAQTGKTLEELKIEERDRERYTNSVVEQKRLVEAGVLGFISSSRDERVWTAGFRRWRELDPNQLPRDVEMSIRLSDYDYLNSRLSDGEDVQVEANLEHRFTPGPIPTYNTIAEIPGTTKPDEVVIVSAHLDSWNGPGSMGTTDNGTGSSVTLEAARILMAAKAKPKRTIRFILWTGEEQGLLGSAAYVKANPDMLPKISAVFVDDGGTNYEGGLSCTDEMAPILAAATAPVNGVFTDSVSGNSLVVNIRPQGEKFQQSGGSDHASFTRVGVPGFFWDEIGRAEYGYGWHTQNDKIGLAIPEYLMQSATCAAVTAYNLACAPDMLPRWKMEEPSEGGGGRRQRPAEGSAPSASTAPPATTGTAAQ